MFLGDDIIKFRFHIIIVISLLFLISCSYNKEEVNINTKKIIEVKEDKILNKIMDMTLEEKIGQLFIVGFDGSDSLSEKDISLIKDYKVGGLIFFSKNITSGNGTINLINKIKEINSDGIPLFLSLDQEGGLVTRLPKEIIKFEKASELGDKNDEDYTYIISKVMGEVIHSLGFNMNYAPVVDIYTNKNNTVLKSRSFSSDRDIVSRLAIKTMEGLRDSGIISVAKHYPGHGDTNEDSHYELPILEHTYERIMDMELVPFKQIINKGIDSIMVSHLLYKNIDPDNIATFSRKFLYDILRKELKFTGIVITDDMIMKGLTNTMKISEASVKVLNAGGDILLIGSGYEDIVESIELIKRSVLEGLISEVEIDRKVYNILRIKEKYNINNEKVESVDINLINNKIKNTINNN